VKNDFRSFRIKLAIKTIIGLKEKKNNIRILSLYKRKIHSSNLLDRVLLAMGISRNM
jgi:hypothetical protein